jgi:phosphoserine phosphatase RsbU/P
VASRGIEHVAGPVEGAASSARDELAELLGQLLGVVGHDLRTALAVATMMVDVLRERPDLPEDLRDPLARAAAANARMEALVRDLVDFGAIRFGPGLALKRRPVLLADLWRVADAGLRLAFRGRTVIGQVAEDLGGDWDGPRIAQALGNVAAQAIGLAPRGAAITIDAVRTPEGVTVVVASPGALAPAPPSRLLEPFAQRPDGGNGLGLAVAADILRAHGGALAIAADQDGVRLELRLP